MISWGSIPLGALLGGIIGQAFGPPAVFISAALIHTGLLFSRLILTDDFMAQIEAHARRERRSANHAAVADAMIAAEVGR